MANQEHVEILKQGVEVWNKWRKDNPDVSPDLSNAKFVGSKLFGVNFSKADLSGADFSDAILINVYLNEANLSKASLYGADISRSDLNRADFSEADISEARLINADISGANITGVNLSRTIRDYWKIENIRCDYVFWDLACKERTPKDRDFRPGEFEELYRWRPLNDFERLIERSIVFPPEYKQAGVSILNYFSEILRKKYPESQATVQIKQDGLKISMVIDPAKGEREIIEKTLNDYGLVITGQMPPEEFTDDKHLIIELKSELRIAHTRIEMQKDLLMDKSAQVDKLLSIVGNAVQTQHHVHINTQASGGNTINAHDVANSTVVAGSGNKT